MLLCVLCPLIILMCNLSLKIHVLPLAALLATDWTYRHVYMHLMGRGSPLCLYSPWGTCSILMSGQCLQWCPQIMRPVSIPVSYLNLKQQASRSKSWNVSFVSTVSEKLLLFICLVNPLSLSDNFLSQMESLQLVKNAVHELACVFASCSSSWIYSEEDLTGWGVILKSHLLLPNQYHIDSMKWYFVNTAWHIWLWWLFRCMILISTPVYRQCILLLSDLSV